MISTLKGSLVSLSENKLLLEVNSIGYEILISLKSYFELEKVDLEELILIHTQSFIKDEKAVLYGFLSVNEKDMFLELLKVSGVGPKAAINILSKFNSDELAIIVGDKNIKKISSVPGIGKKTAERICIDLADKIQIKIQSTDASLDDKLKKELKDALISLGYSLKEAIKLVDENFDKKLASSDMLKLILRKVSL
ncbi:MAG: Holliday junction branch migration protein RuvA [Psittacicella sp.]